MEMDHSPSKKKRAKGEEREEREKEREGEEREEERELISGRTQHTIIKACN